MRDGKAIDLFLNRLNDSCEVRSVSTIFYTRFKTLISDGPAFVALRRKELK